MYKSPYANTCGASFGGDIQIVMDALKLRESNNFRLLEVLFQEKEKTIIRSATTITFAAVKNGLGLELSEGLSCPVRPVRPDHEQIPRLATQECSNTPFPRQI
jgi:hypothetical protein